MTELVIARNAAKVIRSAVTVDRDQPFFSSEGRARACLMQQHFERRVVELEAREPKDPAPLAERVARLEKAMREHRHYSSFKEGPVRSGTAVDYEAYPPMPAGF